MCILKGERIYNYKCLQVTKQRDDMVGGEDISYFLPYQKIIPRFEFSLMSKRAILSFTVLLLWIYI